MAVLHQGGKSEGVLGPPERYGSRSVRSVVRGRQHSSDSLRDLVHLVNYLGDPRDHRHGPSLQKECLSLLVQSDRR